jgi:hypothetical protein
MLIKSSDADGRLVDADELVSKYFEEAGALPSAIGDAVEKLRFDGERANVFFHGGRLWIGDHHAEDVFSTWKESKPHWFKQEASADGVAAAFGPDRTLKGVTTRLNEVGAVALKAEAEKHGFSLRLNDDGSIKDGTLLNLKVKGNANNGVNGHGPDLRANPIVNLRNADGVINPAMTKKLEDMRRAKGGQRLVETWIKEAVTAGYSLDGRKIR